MTKQGIILYFSRVPDLKIVTKYHAEIFGTDGTVSCVI